MVTVVFLVLFIVVAALIFEVGRALVFVWCSILYLVRGIRQWNAYTYVGIPPEGFVYIA